MINNQVSDKQDTFIPGFKGNATIGWALNEKHRVVKIRILRWAPILQYLTQEKIIKKDNEGNYTLPF